jgi:uncharacterized RDD family membrane protein YckC
MIAGQAQMKECPTCGVVTDAQWFCRNCGDFLRAPGTGRTLAGLWRRFAGVVLDILLFYLLLVIGWFIWFAFAANGGQTPGKKLLGLRVIQLDGTVAKPGTMWLREVLIKGVLWYTIAGGLGALVAYIWAFFDRDRQTVHDKMVGTYVIHYPGPAASLQPVPLQPGEQFGGRVPQPTAVEGTESALRRLAKMREDGLITDEEYERKRKDLAEKL